MRKLGVVHKEVGGHLIPYNLQPPCVRKLGCYLTKYARIAALIALNDESLVTQSVCYLCRYRAVLAAKIKIKKCRIASARHPKVL